MIGALRNRNFILLWQGQFVSQIGNQAYLIALMFWLLEQTGSVAVMGLVLMTSSIPGVVLGPLAGAFVDRHSRKAIIVGSDLARGIAVAVLTITMFVSASTDLIIAMLFVVAVINGVAAAVFNPAVGAAIPDLVPPTSLSGANSLNQMSAQGASVLGLAAGGTIYVLFGPIVLFAADAISFLLSAWSESFISLPGRKSIESSAGLASYGRDIVDGWRFVAERRGMLIFIVQAAVINLLFMPMYILLPFFTTEVLGKGSEWYGFMLAGMGVGSIVGLITVGWLRYAERPSFVALNLVGVGLLMLLLGALGNAYAVVAVMAGLGFLTAQINILVFTFLQMRTPEELRGRVMALVMTLAGVATPIGLGVGGVLIELTGRHVVGTYFLLGSVALAVTVAGASSRSLRAFLGSD